MIAFCHACNMTALLCHIGFLSGAMIAFGRACNMTAMLCHRVSGWGVDSIAFCHACSMTALLMKALDTRFAGIRGLFNCDFHTRPGN